jgi:hypothetical protein
MSPFLHHVLVLDEQHDAMTEREVSPAAYGAVVGSTRSTQQQSYPWVNFFCYLNLEPKRGVLEIVLDWANDPLKSAARFTFSIFARRPSK